MRKTIIERMCAIVDKMRNKENRKTLSMDNMDKAATDIRVLSKLSG